MAEPRERRKPRKKDPKDIKSTKPETTQKGKKRTTTRDQAVKLNAEKLERVVNKIQQTKAEKNLSLLSMSQLINIATRLKVKGLSNLRKNDIIILIIREWEGRV